TIQFKYSFASEEYPEYVDSPYNDVFAVFVTGPNPAGGNYLNRNFAKTPINQNVCVSSINQDDSRELYYSNNISGATSIIYDGITECMTANISVIPGQLYTITFAIADAADCYFDSGVFIASSDSEIHDLPNVPNTDIICFPNPVTSEVRWLAGTGVIIDEVVLYDERGRLIVNVQDPENTRSLDMTEFGHGVYMLRIRTRSQNFTFKLVKID
ncbi:MAG TPA: choice-of-anchor L domain-containing protein, partial [Bacteroidia bacterium]|nr:choice-of-anchor L domain-containing protein [Bacteroidia bacterium]